MEKAEVIKAFHLMWDNYPESAMLIDKSVILLLPIKSHPVQDAQRATSVLQLSRQNSTRAAGQKKRGRMVKPVIVKVGKLGDVVSFWIPVDGYPDYLVHFSVGSIQKYEYNV